MSEGPMLLSMTQLKERGWTAALVKNFLGPSDATKPNPYYHSAAPMHLYALARVEEVERRADWKKVQARVSARSEVSRAVAKRRAAELVKEAERLPISVTRLPLDRLRRRAIASYNAFHQEMLAARSQDYEPASAHSDPAFLGRITVNYIRHHLTEYDVHLEEVAGQVGVSEAMATIRRRVYAEIAANYPEYAEECQRQIQFRYGEAS